MRAAALNAQDIMSLPIILYSPANHIEELVPCADEAGEVKEEGKGGKWKVGDRVLVHANSWIEDGEEMLTVPEVKTKGADKYQGTLRKYAVWARFALISSSFLKTSVILRTIPVLMRSLLE